MDKNLNRRWMENYMRLDDQQKENSSQFENLVRLARFFPE